MFALLDLNLPWLLILLVFVIGGTVLWIWALVDCLRNEPSQGNDKIIWTLVIVLTHWVGGLLYLIIRRPKRIQELGR
jgi:Phospholipase_D-nuclease N-terminal